jgi:hypothetical protein
LSFRAVCLTNNPQLRRSLRRSLQGAGSVVEFASVEAADDLGPADLVVVDADARRRLDLGRLGARTGAQVLVVGESLAENEVLELLRARELNHVVTATDDPSFLVTSGKLRGGDLFGVEKYLAWGALVHERPVKTYDEKRRALADLARFAVEAGARRPVAARVEDVADELIMNAIYDAPAIRHGVSPREAAALDPDVPACLRFACDGRTLGVSVRDRYGELTKEAILDSVTRARAQRDPRPDPRAGAGLGLHMVVRSVVRFVANIDPGRLTEVIGLFDLDATGREQDGCAKSLHIFTTRAGA